MSVGSPTDALFGACHVVGRIPALGVAICLGFASYAGVIPVELTNPPSTQQSCTLGTEYFLIDAESLGRMPSVGECLEEVEVVSRAELKERCLRPEARNEDICAQL